MNSEDRNPVDVLADEFAARLRRGESPSMQEYVDRYPDYAAEIEELFPGVALLEQLSERQESESNNTQRQSQDSLPSGHRFGDIEIIREIGRGGMGVVYEAYQHSLNRPVAVKAITGSSVHSPNQAARFQREAQAAAQLHHTNIVPVFGVGDYDGTSYYVMQLIHGVGLDAVLSELVRKTRKSPADASGCVDEPDSYSARDLADVLVSGRLSESSTGALGGPTLPTLRELSLSDRAEAPTVIEHRGENRTEDRTGEIEGRATAPKGVRSSFELRDAALSGGGVRSSMVLQEEFEPVETFGDTGPSAQIEETPVTVDPSLAALGSRYWRNIARIGVQVASGLQYAHSQGTLHRDIKPANILLDTEGTAWIADFGLAKVLQQEDVTKTGDVVGTLRYMAPEQFRGESDGRSDLYSLGLTLYEMLTLRPADADSDRQRLIARKLTPHDPPAPRKLHPGIPRDLETIVLKCLTWEPSDRYQTAGALVADLQAFLGDRPIKARRISPGERFWRWCRRNPVIAALSTAVVLLLLTVTTLMSVGYMRAEDRARQMADLRKQAEDGRRAAEYSATLARLNAKKAGAERTKSEQIADLQWDALNRIYSAFVPDRFAGPVEASTDTEEASALESEQTATVLSPQTAAMLEEMLASFEEISAIRGTDERYLEETARANQRVGDLHRRLGQYDEAVSAFERAIARYNDLKQIRPEDQSISVELARLHNGLGVARQHLGQTRQARTDLRTALDLLTSEAVNEDDPTVRFEIAATYYLMGKRPPRGSRPPRRDRSSNQNAPASNAAHVVNVAESPRGRPGRPPREVPPISPQERRGAPGEGRGPLRESRSRLEDLQQAIAILKPLVDDYPDVPEYRFLAALTYIEIDDETESHRADDDRTMLDEAIGLLSRLVELHPDEPDYVFQLSEAHEQRYYRWKVSRRYLFLAAIPPLLPGFGREDDSVDLQSIEAAERDLRTALKLSEQLMRQQPNVEQYARSHRSLLFNLADLRAYREDPSEARDLVEEADDLQEFLAERFPEAESGFDFRTSFREMLKAHTYVQSGEPSTAREGLEQLLARLEEPDRGTRRSGGTNLFEKYYSYMMLNEIYHQLGETELAEASRAAVEQIRRTASEWRGREGSESRSATRGATN